MFIFRWSKWVKVVNNNVTEKLLHLYIRTHRCFILTMKFLIFFLKFKLCFVKIVFYLLFTSTLTWDFKTVRRNSFLFISSFLLLFFYIIQYIIFHSHGNFCKIYNFVLNEDHIYESWIIFYPHNLSFKQKKEEVNERSWEFHSIIIHYSWHNDFKVDIYNFV